MTRINALMVSLMTCVMVGGLIQAKTAQAQGTIEIAEKFEGGQPAGKRCTVSLPDGPYSFEQRLSEIGCINSSAYIRFDNVESAAVIELWDQRLCGLADPENYSNDWLLVVRTIKQPTTTKWLALSEIGGRDPLSNSIITPGLRLLGKNVRKPDWSALSCIRVMRPLRQF